MGAITGIFDGQQPWLARQRLASVLAGVVLMTSVCAAPSLSESGTLHRNHPDDRPVSTSPVEVELAEPGSPGAQPTTTPETDGPPLTRAAAQRRIDEMSPTRWLSRYGSVSIGHRN